MPYLLLIIGIVLVGNFYIFYSRYKKNSASAKRDIDSRNIAERHHEELKRRLDREQEDAARRVELRNKTLEMYEQVRRQAENPEDET